MDKKRNPTIKQRKLVKGILEGKTKKQAWIDAWYSAKTASVIVSQNLKKLNVQQLIEDEAENAFSVIKEIMKEKDSWSAVRLNAAKDVMDRAGFKPTEKKELNIKGISDILAEL